MHKTAISKIENGSRPLSFEEVMAISDFFSVPIKYFSTAYSPENSSKLWAQVRDSFKSLSEVFSDSMDDLEQIESQLEKLLDTIRNDISPDRQYRIRPGILEMQQFTDLAASTLSEIQIMCATYGLLSNLEQFPPETAHVKERQKWWEYRIEEVRNFAESTSNDASS